MKVASLFGRHSSLPDPPTEDGPVRHVSRGKQKAQTASQYSSVYSYRPDYISQRPLLIHTTHKNKALASDTTKP